MNEMQARERIKSIYSSGDRLAGFYAFIMNNPHLSFWNCVQIYSAKPSATVCKSFDDWHDQDNRRIKRGEHGIVYYDENSPNRRQYVFDITQTYGSERYRSVQHKINVRRLCSYVRSQTTFGGLPKENESELQAAVHRYCLEHYGYGYGESEEYDEEYLACLAEGVTHCLSVYTGNNGIEIKALPFDEDTNFRLGMEVLELTEGLQAAIIEQEQRHEQQRKERERARVIRENYNIEGDEQNERKVHQVTLWELAQGVFENGISDAVSDNADDGNIEQRPETDRNAGREIASSPYAKDAETVVAGLSDELADGAADRTADRGNGADGDRVPPARNYRLTEENFAYATGAKTRFRQNVEAIRLMKRLQEEDRAASDDEKRVLSKYVGWGGLAYAFDSEKEEWSKEYKELLELLTTDEYRSAKDSVLSAHYTPKTVIDGVYGALARMGFTKGKILEPAMGIGNFIGLMPDSFNARESYGVEIDSVSGNIAKLLYPQTKVKITGFEKTNFANNSFDGVITNVPFGSFKVYDPEYDRLGFYIHNYFLAKSLDKIRPGGIIAAITTKGTLDRADTSVRQYLANRAKLLGAIRLPNTAFKTSAGTEVTADILFFQKRDKIVEKAKDSWINVGRDENGVPVNQYYIEHAEMLLGTMVQHKSMYGRDDETELLPDDRELGQALAQAIAALPEKVYDASKAVPVGEEIAEARLPLDEQHKDLKNYCYTFIGNTLYQREQDELVARDLAKSNLARMKALVTLREQVRNVLNVQLDGCSDEILTREQGSLNRQYDSFVKNYGIVNSRLNRSLFRDDADFALLISIENVDEKSGTAKKTDVFSKRTIKPFQRVEHCNDAMEALHISKSEKGEVDLRFMEQLTGRAMETLVQELNGKIYRNPAKCILDEGNKYLGWETASEYLSGNVREKLKMTELAVENGGEYQPNVEALRQAQPAPLTAADISIKLGATWVDEKFYHQFICELMELNNHYARQNVELAYVGLTGEWKVKRPPTFRYAVKANQIYGTERMDAYELFERCLNLQTPTITDEVEDADGKKRRVTNKADTIAVRERQKKMQAAFKQWIFDDPERREYLVEKYNRLFNTTVVPQFDGSYLQFPGMNPEITLKPYQKDAVARILQGGNTLLHHCVGAGKTFEIAAACMKLREIGAAQKPIIVVPNHLVVQWANEFRSLYPNANLLMATKKDFEKTSRKRFVAKVATGDWDAVIIAMSSFEKVPLSKERQQERIDHDIAIIEEAVTEAKRDDGKRLTVKNLQRTLKNKQAQLERLLNESKKDDLLQFEHLGVDYIFVDEAHKYKNKFLFTKMNNVSGISTAMSQRATDMDLKCEYINDMRGGDKGVVFATGTPISNSLVEMYTMQTYLQRGELQARGLHYFDAWAANFTETVTALELAPSGQGYRSKTRVAKFTNLPELLKMYRSFADVKTADMLNLPVPKADKKMVEIEPTEEIISLNAQIVKRSERIAGGSVNPSEDNMLCVTHDGKMIALDPRCYDKSLPDNPNNKVNGCVANIYSVWERTAEKKGTQIVFCDLSTPKKRFEDYNALVDFDVYNDIKYKLVKLGIPQEQIAYIHDAKTDQQKQDIFDKVRNGEIRVLLGSTEKCGAGTNIQDRLVALHHLDTPYRPSDLEQREGRIVRQGNLNEEVMLFTYVTKRTFDAYSYQILETKQRFISQINHGDYSVRVAEDIDDRTLSYAEIKAITADNPKIKRKMEIEQRLSELSTLETQHRMTRYSLQNTIMNAPKEIEKIISENETIRTDIQTRDLHKSDLLQIGKRQYEERKDAGAILLQAVKSKQYIGKTIGFIKGFRIVPQDGVGQRNYVKLIGAGEYKVELSDDAVGSIIRMENQLNGFEDSIGWNERQKADRERDMAAAQSQIDVPFEFAGELETLQTELSEIDAELDLGKAETPIVLDNENEIPKIEVLDEKEEEMEVA